MLTNPLIVARKELVDHLRDTRSLASSALFTLMGPAVVLLVSIGRPASSIGTSAPSPLPVMAAVFAFVSAFSGGLSVAMDMIAGERERRSLVPLLVNAVSRLDIVIGKWLAVVVFAAAGLFINFAAFALVLAASQGVPDAASGKALLSAAPALFSLAALAASLEILVSAMCRSVKEAHTYLTMLVFAAMGIGMWLAFHPNVTPPWWFLAPVAGQLRLLEYCFARHELLLTQSMALAATTAILVGPVLMTTGRVFRRDEVVYGG